MDDRSYDFEEAADAAAGPATPTCEEGQQGDAVPPTVEPDFGGGATGAPVLVYEFENSESVRLTLIDGEPWFVAGDVAEILGIANVRQSLAAFAPDEKRRARVEGPRGGAQQTTVISEPGLYRMIFQSRKPAAERFKRWVFHEVLPALRQEGRYAMAAPERETAIAGDGSLPVCHSIGGVQQLLWLTMKGALLGAITHDKCNLISLLADRYVACERKK